MLSQDRTRKIYIPSICPTLGKINHLSKLCSNQKKTIKVLITYIFVYNSMMLIISAFVLAVRELQAHFVKPLALSKKISRFLNTSTYSCWVKQISTAGQMIDFPCGAVGQTIQVSGTNNWYDKNLWNTRW